MDLYFCFDNFVRFHRTIRATPAMLSIQIGDEVFDLMSSDFASAPPGVPTPSTTSGKIGRR
jgi:hypothetical protein